jgi:LuxR family maltose regulon positive regulatory protein
MELLAAGSRRKLTLVSAPAGYGKTTLVADWIDSSQAPAAWLSLDQADNDPIRFLTYVIGAMQRIDERIGVDVQVVLTEAQSPPGSAILIRLVNDIAAATGSGGRQCVLVLDDYHLITAQPVHKVLAFLVEHLPEAMHLLLVGRSDPPLPISRLRVQGEITEIRTPELRFTKEEAAVFLNDLMGLGLAPADVAALEARTEGWIASLQLAALSLRRRPDKHQFVAAFSGSHRYVIDYLMDEVLSRQPTTVHSFLLQTSILDRFCAPLCDAVCFARSETPRGSEGTAAPEESNSLQILRQLEEDNLFLVPLDEERRWYRFHHLFAGFLQQRLHQRESDQIPELHRRASQWFEDEGLVDEAIQHALKAGDLNHASRLVDQIAASLVVRREPNKLLKLVDPLPRDLCRDYPMLCMWYAWALLFAGHLEEVEPALQVAEAHQRKAPQLPMTAYAITIRAYLANQMGDLQKAVELTQQAMEQLSQAPPEQITLIFRGAAVIWLGVNYRHLGHLDRARQLFNEAAALNQQAGNYYGTLASVEQQGDLAMIQGHLHRAVEIYRRGLEMAHKWSNQKGAGRGALPAATGLHLGLGTVLYQWNDLAGAAIHLQRACDLGELGRFWGRMHCYRMLAYLKHAQEDYQAAYDLLRQAWRIRESVNIRQVNTAAEPSLEQLGIRLSRIQPEMVHLRADIARDIEMQGLGPDDDVDYTSPEEYAREPAYSVLARLLIALGRAGESLPLIQRLLEAARSMERQGDAIRYLVLQALAFQTMGDNASALTSLRQALTLAEPEGYVRIFVDEGEPMAALLSRAAAQSIAPAYTGRLLAAFPEQERQAIGFTQAALDVSQPLIDPLSPRELEVLRLMAAGLRHKEIAAELVISLNTVRHHARNVYGKLGVHRRAQAIAIAKQLNLL